MYLASSNSNQLTTLYFYFRHWVSQTNRNFLVLDEPEENLHPKHQYELLNTLIDFTAKGNKLLLTTHSILKENLSNSVDIVENNINGNTILQRTTIKDTLIQNPTSNDHFSIDFINDIISKV
jgi:ABC-type cobalamin/Fe3+-siderophores transport system ATPase subunit